MPVQHGPAWVEVQQRQQVHSNGVEGTPAAGIQHKLSAGGQGTAGRQARTVGQGAVDEGVVGQADRQGTADRLEAGVQRQRGHRHGQVVAGEGQAHTGAGRYGGGGQPQQSAHLGGEVGWWLGPGVGVRADRDEVVQPGQVAGLVHGVLR